MSSHIYSYNSHKKSGIKVAVIGAGIAGLAAAFELRKLGWITGAFVNFQPGQGQRFFFDLFKPDYENRVYFAGVPKHPRFVRFKR